jgi:meso-butanediol dehydrogenase/(S,S)-butanediol dehydrogenase/diacetyl reductase
MGLFDGQVALVSGAARGIGEATASALLGQGARVLLFDRNAVAVKQTCTRLAAGRKDRVLAEVGDVSCRDDVRRAVSAAVDEWDKLDTVVAAAGIASTVALDAIDDESWREMIDVNLGGVFVVVQESARAMSHGGVIVVIGSTNAFFVEEHTAHYSASKGGVHTFVRAAAMDLARRAIRINVIHPGVIRTPLASWIDEEPDAAAAFVNRVPLRRFGDPDEIAQVALFLASDAASYMTGAAVVVDGGVSIGASLGLRGEEDG